MSEVAVVMEDEENIEERRAVTTTTYKPPLIHITHSTDNADDIAVASEEGYSAICYCGIRTFPAQSRNNTNAHQATCPTCRKRFKEELQIALTRRGCSGGRCAVRRKQAPEGTCRCEPSSLRHAARLWKLYATMLESEPKPEFDKNEHHTEEASLTWKTYLLPCCCCRCTCLSWFGELTTNPENRSTACQLGG